MFSIQYHFNSKKTNQNILLKSTGGGFETEGAGVDVVVARQVAAVSETLPEF